MAIFKLYSKQQAALTSPPSDVYQYAHIPQPLRIQAIQILEDCMGIDTQVHDYACDMQIHIRKTLCREYGVFDLPGGAGTTLSGQIQGFALGATPEQFLDLLQVSWMVIYAAERHGRVYRQRMRCKEAFKELNYRFKEHSVGFQFVNGQIIRIDSEFTHKEITLPAISLLHQKHMAGAQQEFLTAHEHFRHRRYKECINECLKAFESTMKAICTKREWQFDPNAQARTLVNVCAQNGLFPAMLESHLNGLRMTLESGVPTARNKTSGHGQGTHVKTVSPVFASYILNLTATNVRFLAEAEQGLP